VWEQKVSEKETKNYRILIKTPQTQNQNAKYDGHNVAAPARELALRDLAEGLRQPLLCDGAQCKSMYTLQTPSKNPSLP